MTFSIVARCHRTGELGAAVASAVPAVGAVCSYVLAQVGAVSTQAWVNPYLALNTLELLGQGKSATEALGDALKSDPAGSMRQLGIVDRLGHAASWTGPDCTEWAGHHVGPGYAIQGNMLAGAAVIEAMVDAFDASVGNQLCERLLGALEAGQLAGGDKRGRQSAALKVVRDEAYAFLDLRVDEHDDPVSELRRVFCVAQVQVVPFIEGMSTRSEPGRVPSVSVTELLLKPPPLRPGARVGATVTADTESKASQAAILAEWFGVAFAPDRVAQSLNTYRTILLEIRKLREIDLSDHHPAVIFSPTLGYPSLMTDSDNE
jgi:uncharacterized Ntn-hydrolase superfamily protein